MFDDYSLIPRVGEQEVIVQRHFSAPRTLLFQVFTRAEHLALLLAFTGGARSVG